MMKVVITQVAHVTVAPLDLIHMAIQAVERCRSINQEDFRSDPRIDFPSAEIQFTVDTDRFTKEQADKFELHTLTEFVNREAWNM